MLAPSLLLAGCASPTELPQGLKVVWHMVVTGDSSLWGLGEGFESQIEKDVRVKEELQDFALNAMRAGKVFELL